MTSINDIKIGRDNMALTVFVPTDCISNCAFCTTKKMYKDMNIDDARTFLLIEQVLTDFPDINELVFTGGEPALALSFMEKAIKKARTIKTNIKIYINTEYKLNRVNFRKFCEHNLVDGVSISHHTNNVPLEERDQYSRLARVTSVRLNHLMNRGTHELINSFDYAMLNLKYDIILNVREDYRKLRAESFKSLKMAKYEQIDVSECLVSHTIKYKNHASVVFTYHKGLATSSIIENGKTIINDIIIHPDGKLYSDWNEEEFKYFIPSKKITKFSGGSLC